VEVHVRCASVALVVALGALPARGHAKNGMNIHSAHKHRAVATPAAVDAPAIRDALAAQLADQAAAIGHALALVADKLTAVDHLRARHVHAAYRAVHAPTPDDASADDRMAAARRRAGAHAVLERDRGERALLVGEVERLRAARVRTADAAARVPTIVLPESIDRPARGTIVRKFGTLVHERSGATLSRRGIDIEVDEHAHARAVADGVVTYVGPIRGLERGVVVDHGDYVTVVAKLGDVTVAPGARVARGERIGRAARHRVYLEVRVKVGPGGLPIDPEPLLTR
jgi:murein DD-endopeptidase MepM/ murein hydrolase activator NlpD